MRKTTPLFQVDAFTDRPFTGNPAAVCLLSEARESDWMQAVAAEMNLSETAFVQPLPGGGYELRWFTPTVEVDLCGHATLASAHVLWEEGRLQRTEAARFHTRSGVLCVEWTPEGMVMDFPALPAAAQEAPAGLNEALGAAPTWVGRSRHDLLVELASDKAVRQLVPELSRIGAIAARGVIVTARAETGPWDFVSRFFAPAVGIDEDPVTGSAHCVLGPYWAGRLGRERLTGFQASRRGGTVHIELRGERLGLGGQALTILKGALYG